jgi:hypothetical protein
MPAALNFYAAPSFRDLQGQWATADQDMFEARRELMQTQAQRFVQLAGTEAPGGIGHTVANQITYETYVNGQTMGFRIKQGQVARWQSEGTGIYGPSGQPIVPLRAQVLHFFIQGTEFFRRSVRGVPPNDYMGRAYPQWLPGAQADLRKIAQRFIARFKGSGGTTVTP